MFRRNHAILLTFIMASQIGLSACSALLDFPTPTPPPPTCAPSPSPTIVWFPPTDTPTPYVASTQAPTPEQKPGVGSVLLTDDFSSPELWDLHAGIDVSDNQLTIAAQPGTYASSFRTDVILNDFYAEITASPVLCMDHDEYGLLFRAPNSIAYYSYTLTCDGKARLDRISVNTHESLQPATPSGDAPTGSPGQVRLGVWAVGSDLRFFLNGRYQFSVTDRNYASGGIGVFANAVADTPVTVTFSNLVIYDVTYVPPTRTPSP